jgi:hypothetical protein
MREIQHKKEKPNFGNERAARPPPRADKIMSKDLIFKMSVP